MNRFNEIERALIEEAAAFAAKAHEGQQRKYTGEPYIVHPKAVAEAVEKYGLSAEAVAAAWLHDVVEDCDVGVHEIRIRFGDEVAALVIELTKVTEVHDGNRAFRTAKNRAALANVSATAQSIKVADLIDNSYSIVERNPKFAKIYLVEARAVLEVLTKADPTLVATADSVLKQQNDKLARAKSLSRQLADKVLQEELTPEEYRKLGGKE